MKNYWHILLIVGLAASAEFISAQFINQAQAAPAPAAKAKVKTGANELPPNFAAGVKAYQEKRYNEAISYFREAISKENGGANGWLYLAHSYFAMGMRYQATQSYQTITEQFKGSAQAARPLNACSASPHRPPLPLPLPLPHPLPLPVPAVALQVVRQAAMTARGKTARRQPRCPLNRESPQCAPGSIIRR